MNCLIAAKYNPDNKSYPFLFFFFKSFRYLTVYFVCVRFYERYFFQDDRAWNVRSLNFRLGRGLAHHLVRSPEIHNGEKWGPSQGRLLQQN